MFEVYFHISPKLGLANADNLVLAVANKHLPVLQGTEIDYIKEGVNQRFQFNNPNETASCGCGESFSVDKD